MHRRAHRRSRPAALPLYTSQGLELEKDNATYVRCTKQELQLVVDALAQRKEESLEFKERAIEAFNVQNFKRAEQHLSSAIELDPENHVFYSNRAAAYMAMEKFDRALKDANECVRLQPTWAKGYSRQAAALLSMGDLPAAREACLKGLDLEPDNVQARARPASAPAARPPPAPPPPPPPRSISLSWGASSLTQTMTVALAQRPRRQPGNRETGGRLAPTHLPPTSHEAAGPCALHTPQPPPPPLPPPPRPPHPPPSPRRRAQVKEELRRVEIAESLALKDSATEAFKAQDYEKAVDDLTAAVALDPTNQVFFSNRSVAYTAMQMYEKALEDADECVRLQPTWAKGYSRRAAAKFHLGDLQAAKLAYSKAWDLEPTNAKTKADLEHVLSEIAGMRVVLPDRQA